MTITYITQIFDNTSPLLFTDNAVQMKLGNLYRVFNKFDSLLNFRLFNRFTAPCVTAATTTGIKLMIDTFMIELTTLSSRACCRFRFGGVNDIRRWRLGGVGRIFLEFSNLISKFCIDFNKFGNLFFNIGNALNIEIPSIGSQFSSSSRLLWLLPGERGPPLEKICIFQLESQPLNMLRSKLKI